MNFLAHAYLSFGDPGILTGNMISDFVKGRKMLEYDIAIQNGMRLHRAIDAFTDEHPVTKRAATIFKPAYRLYSMAFIDVVYDHFLACDENIFTDRELYQFSQDTYRMLSEYEAVFPPVFKGMFPYMVSQNWLYGYRTHEGTKMAFGGLVRRAKYMNDSEPAYKLFLSQYNFLKDCYNSFFPELFFFVKEFKG